MRKNTKRNLICLLACGVASVGLLGYSELAANAASEDPFKNFKISETAEIRTSDPVGIRFTTGVDDAVKAEVGEDAVFGTLVIPKALLDAEAELTLSTDKVANVAANKWLDDEKTSYAAAIVGQTDSDGNFTDLPEEFYDDVFYARGYVTYGGETVYTTNHCERSIAYVASALLASGETGETAELYASIVDYVNPTLAWDATIADGVELAFGSSNNTVSLSESSDTKGLVVKYSSSDEDIVKYEKGKLIAVGAGTATITAEIGSEKANLDVKVNARTFASGVLNDFLLTEDSGGGNWHPDATPVLVNLADKGLSAPTKADGYNGPLTKKTAIEWNINQQGQVSNWINLYGFFEKIDSYNAMDRISIWLYLDMDEYTSNTSVYATQANQWGTVDSTYGGTILNSYAKPTLKAWTKISFTVGELQKAMTNKLTYGGVGLALRPMANSSKGESVYLYSVEVEKADGLIVNDVATKGTDFGHLGWWGDRWGTETTPAAVGAPAGLTAKNTLNYYTNNDAIGQLGPMFDVSAVMTAVASLDPMDYVSIWMYANASSIAASAGNSFVVKYFLSSKFAQSPEGSDATKLIESGKFVSFNQWTEIQISVGELQALSKNWTGANALTKIGFILTPKTSLGTTAGAFKAYFHSVVFHTAKTTANANTVIFSKNAWGVGGAFSMVETPAEIGVPEGKTNGGELLKFVSDGSGQAMFQLNNVYANATTLAGELGDNDTLRIWVYVDGGASVSARTLWIGAPSNWNKMCAQKDTSDSIEIGKWSAWDITGAEIKELLANWKTYAAEQEITDLNGMLMLKLQVSTSSAVNYYFHSVEIVKA